MATWGPIQLRLKGSRQVEFDGEASPAPGGGGGGGLITTVPVTSAEILDLANTPKVLIPGTPNFVTVVTGVGIVYLAGGTPYSDFGGTIVVQTVGQSPVATQGGANFWDQATDQVYVAGYGGSITAAVSAMGGIDVVLSNTGNNPTLGDGTLSVTVAYFLCPAF